MSFALQNVAIKIFPPEKSFLAFHVTSDVVLRWEAGIGDRRRRIKKRLNFHLLKMADFEFARDLNLSFHFVLFFI